MAREIYAFSVSVPPGTPIAAPQLTPLSMPPRSIQSIEIRVPPGPRGQLGFALAAAGTPIIPVNAGQWIISDDERINWPLEDQITSGAWQLLAYNLGTQAHTLYLRFLAGLTAPATVLAPSGGLIPNAQLSSG